MQLHDCLPHLLYSFPNEADLLRAIKEVSEKFTVKREHIGDYLSDRRLLSAYTAFYFTTNFPKLEEVLKWMPEEWLDMVKGKDLVDIGSGPGTFGLAWKQWAGPLSGKIFQVETSALMVEQARKLWDAFGPPEDMTHLKQMMEIPGSVLLFGHSANEMSAEKVIQYIERINPEHVLFIEPGTKDFFPKMLEIRRQLIEQDFSVIFPCPAEGECPMAGSAKDWCHQFIRVKQPPELERISQMIKLDRKLMPLTVHLYSKTYRKHERERVVRVLPSTKFSFEWEVCTGENTDHYQVMKRGLAKNVLAEIDEVLAGASLLTDLDKELPAVKRVRLIQINNKSPAS